MNRRSFCTLLSAAPAALVIKPSQGAENEPIAIQGSKPHPKTRLPKDDQIMTFRLESAAASGIHPWDFAWPFKRGEAPETVVIEGVPDAQVTVRRRWKDGSVKHAYIAFNASYERGRARTFVVTAANNHPQSEALLTPADIAKARPAASVDCGEYGVAQLADVLHKPVRVWTSGSQMIGCIYRITLQKTLSAWFYVKLFKGGRMYVWAWTEHGTVDANSVLLKYVPVLTVGGKVVYDNGRRPLDHWRFARHGAGGWIDEDPKITPHFDMDHLRSTMMVPKYAPGNPSEAALNRLVQDYRPGSSGNIRDYQPGTGAQDQIGILPKWDALYCISGDKRAYRSVLANSSHLNSYGIFWRDPKTNRVIKPSDWPDWSVYGKRGGGGGHKAGSLQWDEAHHGSGGYLAYLITGDPWHYETMAGQAAQCYMCHGAGWGSGVQRVLAEQVRGVAWTLRTLGQYVGIARDDDEVADDYRALFARQFAVWKARATTPGASQLGLIWLFGQGPAGSAHTQPFWQHNFWIVANAHTWDIEAGFKNQPDEDNHRWVRDFMYKAIVGQLGGDGPDNYCFTHAGRYFVKVGVNTAPDQMAQPLTALHRTWGDVFKADTGSANGKCGNTLMQGGAPFYAPVSDPEGYWAAAWAAISCAVDHSAPGARDSYRRLLGASNWALTANVTRDSPAFALIPRTAD